MPVMTVKIGHNLADRWEKYRLGAPAWPSLTSLVDALLINHFDEAERMEEMIEKQERGRR